MFSTALTVADVFRPGRRELAWMYDIALIMCGSFVIAVSAQLSVPVWPVPLTGQTFAVLLIGMLLGPWRGAICVLTYLAEGAAGLPVFASGNGGLAYMFGTTGGYLIGFVLAAFVAGSMARLGWDRNFPTTIFAMLLGNLCIYALGLAWLVLLLWAGRVDSSLTGILVKGLFVFIPGDIVKAVLAAVLLPSGWKLLRRFSPDRQGRRH